MSSVGIPMFRKLTEWLEAQDTRLSRFKCPVPLTEISCEVQESPEDIRAFVHQCKQPIYHVWEQLYAGKLSRCKPYCLHLSGRDHVCLDWEDSVVGAAEAVFQQQWGYTCRREIGSPEHLSRLCNEPSLDSLDPGSNLRDLWASKRDGRDIYLYILEGKGKQTQGVNFYCFGEALAQVFPISAEPLRKMLGDPKKRASHGLCSKFARQLHAAWTELGLQPKITVGLILPEWSPDIVWSSGKPRERTTGYFSRPLAEFRRFANGELADAPPTSIAQTGFREMLDEIRDIRSLMQAKIGLRFRLLTAQSAPDPFFFRLSGPEEGA
jgi:hypothetical protein